VKYLANFFELVGNLATLFFAGVADHREVWSAHFDPGFLGGRENCYGKNREQGNNKNAKRDGQAEQWATGHDHVDLA
jgi:hypothetical protein